MEPVSLDTSERIDVLRRLKHEFSRFRETEASSGESVLSVNYLVAPMDNVRNTWESLLDDCTDDLLLLRQEIEIEGRKSKHGKEYAEEDEEGSDYPMDVWFIISEYITPESVGTFARICKSSYYVTTTAKFWFHLYKSYYRFVPSLPERLQPQCMVRRHGLRACVIRMLHFTYFPMKWKHDGTSYFRQSDPHSLVKRKCCLMWHEKYKQSWYFYFKLKEISKTHKRSITGKNGTFRKAEFLEMLDNVAVNPEKGCKVLRVTCLEYSIFPPVIGLILQTVSLNLMPGFKDHRLHLAFGTTPDAGTLSNVITFNHVVLYKVLDWWHPQYPHQDAITAIELPEWD